MSPTPHRVAVLLAGSVVGFTLIAIPVVASLLDTHEDQTQIIGFSLLTLVLGVAGLLWLDHAGLIGSSPAQRVQWRPLVYLVALSIPWAMVIVATPHATYFLLALIALALWLLSRRAGALAALTLTLFTILGQVVHHGLSAGSVLGPLLVVLVMLGFMHMYRSMLASSHRTQHLYEELREAQDQLARSEREAGRLAERTRLARDLHDTVAQSLSSMHMLLQLAEANPAQGGQYVRTARRAASDSLAEARAFISALTPPDLEGRTLSAALQRVLERARSRSAGGPELELRVEGEPRPLSMPVETTMVRIAQASMENVLAHAHASRCTVTLAFEPDAVRMEIDDDGIGFDVEAALAAGPGATNGFGLGMLYSRAREMGGYAAVLSQPGAPAAGVASGKVDGFKDDCNDDGGTLVSVTLPTPPLTVKEEA